MRLVSVCSVQFLFSYSHKQPRKKLSGKGYGVEVPKTRFLLCNVHLLLRLLSWLEGENKEEERERKT